MNDNTQTDRIKAAKAMARHLAGALRQSGHELPHSNLLEVVAKAFGARNWHAFQAQAPSQDGAAASVGNTAPAALPAVDTEPWNPLYGFATQAQFLAHGDGICPVCGSDEIDGGAVDVEDNTCAQEVTCLACEAEWTNRYALASYQLADSARVQADNRFVVAVRVWLEQELGTDDAQAELDELIVDWHAEQQLPAINATSVEGEQEHLIGDAERAASDLNNRGMTAQLDFLWASLRTRKALLDFLTEKLNLDIASLELS